MCTKVSRDIAVLDLESATKNLQKLIHLIHVAHLMATYVIYYRTLPLVHTYMNYPSQFPFIILFKTIVYYPFSCIHFVRLFSLISYNLIFAFFLYSLLFLSFHHITYPYIKIPFYYSLPFSFFYYLVNLFLLNFSITFY